MKDYKLYVSILNTQLKLLDLEYRHGVRLNNADLLRAIMIEIRIIKEQLNKLKEGEGND